MGRLWSQWGPQGPAARTLASGHPHLCELTRAGGEAAGVSSSPARPAPGPEGDSHHAGAGTCVISCSGALLTPWLPGRACGLRGFVGLRAELKRPWRSGFLSALGS